MLSVLVWWLALQVIGLVALPIVLKLLRFLPDRGFGFARQVGLLLVGYAFWLLVTLGILQNTTTSVVLVLLALAGASAFIWAREGRQMLADLRARWRIVVATEVLFLVAFGVFCLFRSYNPDIAATEKPMEFAFINGILRSRTFPPNDPWLSGYSISYYYFGYIIVALLTRLTGLASDVTFNLTVAMLFALTVSGTFSLVYNMVQAYLDRRAEAHALLGEVVSRASILTGILGAVLVALVGNLEGVFEILRANGGGSEALWRWLDVKDLRATPPSPTWFPNDTWWWWRASRVIHDCDAAGKTVEVIDEFPFFSFLLGDNHPHVLALPFVILALALALNLLLSWRADAPPSDAQTKPGLWGRLLAAIERIWSGGPFDVALWGLLLGGLGFLNTWDYPIYLGVFVLVYAIRRQAAYQGGASKRPLWDWLSDVILMGVLLLAIGIVLYFPFYLSFRSQAGGIGWVGATKTRLHQYLLMLGTSIFFALSLLVTLSVRYRQSPPAQRSLPRLARFVGGLLLLCVLGAMFQRWWTAALALALCGVAATLLIWGSQLVERPESLLPTLESSSLFALLLMIAGLLLTASVEFVFLKDTFGSRMNTVFKFYYQGWVLLAIASAYGVFYVLQSFAVGSVPKRVGLSVWAVAGTFLVGCGLAYTLAAGISKAGGFAAQPTLDGTRYIAQYRKDDYDAIQWLRANARPGATMVEASGGSYSEYNWVSAHTGIPTVLGWGGHELQWRGNYDEPGKREQDIPVIYQNLDPNKTLALLDKYHIDYVYVSRLERDKYRLSQPMIKKFDRFMVRAYEKGDVIVFARR